MTALKSQIFHLNDNSYCMLTHCSRVKIHTTVCVMVLFSVHNQLQFPLIAIAREKGPLLGQAFRLVSQVIMKNDESLTFYREDFRVPYQAVGEVPTPQPHTKLVPLSIPSPAMTLPITFCGKTRHFRLQPQQASTV